MFKPPSSQSSQPTSSDRWKPIARKVLHSFLWALILPIPFVLALSGAWIGSTLAIHHDGPVWLALVGAVIVFMVLPYLWELAADAHQEGGRIRDAILRSSFLSVVLIIVLLATHARTTYYALATRGDWFLANAQTPAAKSIRAFMFDMAEGFHWLDRWTTDVSYAWAGTTEGLDPNSSAVAFGSMLRGAAVGTGILGRGVKPSGFGIPGTKHTWPLDPTPHYLVTTMPASVQTSPEAVGAYLKEHEADAFLRAKAVHDFVASWVKYDNAGLLDGSAKSPDAQSAATVFARRLGICAGYARLTAAIGEAAGLRTVVVSGMIRWSSDYGLTTVEDIEAGEVKRADGDIRGHAWNAIEVDGRWHLLDTTWDNADDGGEIGSTFLFIPPEAMLADHFPDEPKWQLLETPVSHGDWLRSPNVTPMGVYYGVKPLNHVRPVVAHSPTFRLELSNPFHARIWVTLTESRYVSLEENSKMNVGRGTGGSRKAPIKCGLMADTETAVFECPAPSYRFVASASLEQDLTKTRHHALDVEVEAP